MSSGSARRPVGLLRPSAASASSELPRRGIAVFVTPGATALTRMPCGVSSRAMPRVSPTMPRLLGLRDVSADRRGLPAEGGDLRRCRLGGRLVVQVIERHVGPGLGESDRNSAPDTALGAGDEDNLSCAPPVGGHGERCITSRHASAKPWRRTNGPKLWRSGTEYWRALSSDQPYGSV